MESENKIFEASFEEGQMAITKEIYKRVGAGVRPIDVERVDRLMEGAIDTHIHGGPDAYGHRIGDEIEISIEACKSRMKAVVFKCHSSPNARSIPYVQKAVDQWAEQNNMSKTRVFGGVVLNYAVGGLNPEAVEVNGKFGGKYVWLPSIDASHHHRIVGTSGGIEVLGKNDKLLPVVIDILNIIAKYDMILGICHQNTKERFILIEEAQKAGIGRIEICHPLLSSTKMTIEQMKTATDKGAYLGLYCLNLNPPKFFIDEFLQTINTIGAEHIVMGTDLGFWRSPPPIATLRCFIAELLERGVPDATVEKMVKFNAQKLLY